MELRDVDEVIDDYSGNMRKVLEYSLIMKQLVDRAKEPDFDVDSWALLTELVAIDEFDRVGNFKELMDWDQYTTFLTSWATNAQWECSFKRIAEIAATVFLELEERSSAGGATSAVNSMSVYEFNADGKICHIDIYLQMAIPEELLPDAYAGVVTSE